MTSLPERQQLVERFNHAVASGARKAVACAEIGLSLRSLQRWALTLLAEMAQQVELARRQPVDQIVAKLRDFRRQCGDAARGEGAQHERADFVAALLHPLHQALVDQRFRCLQLGPEVDAVGDLHLDFLAPVEGREGDIALLAADARAIFLRDQRLEPALL